MKLAEGWWFPDHEHHLIQWLKHPKASVVMNGRKAYQGKKQQAALALCKQKRVAIDVGGHVGLWSHNLTHEFRQVYAFEPIEAHRECFKKNVSKTNVMLLAYALGAKEGFVSFTTEEGSSGNTHVKSETGDIPMKTLDAFEFKEVDLIKIDCEGYELNVLTGAKETIERCRPTIIVEQKRDMAARFDVPLLAAVTFLTDLGYKVHEEMSGDYLMVP